MKSNRLIALVILIVFTINLSCKEDAQQSAGEVSVAETSAIKYAKGFDIQILDHYKILKVTQAYPGTEKVFTYALVPNKKITSQLPSKENEALVKLLANKEIDAIIQVPIQSVVVTSTTHIPSLEMLGVIETLKGFPNLDYISSPLSRKLIKEEKIKELGQNNALNTEVTIDLNPDALVGFGVDGENKAFASVQRAGIPILYNGDWVERDPLGKAEWIKFFGALYGKGREADSIFNNIETEYQEAKKIAAMVAVKPTVLSGAMYKDVWYVPNGDSWQAKIITDAGGQYLWADTEGTGSIALSIESVLEKAQNANVWIAPGRFTNYATLVESNPVYGQFDAFKNKNTFTFATKKGETGGLLYYELAPNRPDLVLKDLIYSIHPELLPDYQPYFFTPFDE